MASHYQKAYFLLSCADIKQLPPDTGIEIAIVGRSNAGKSSVLNRLTQNKQLARVSKTPGRTQMINIFVLDEERRIADLPGYGYAKVPIAAKRVWEKTIDRYISEREALKGLVLVMDIRHPLKDLDQQLLDYCEARQLPVHILLNKADKLSRNVTAQTVQKVKVALTEYENFVTFQPFSALNGTGVEEFRQLMDQWFDYEKRNGTT